MFEITWLILGLVLLPLAIRNIFKNAAVSSLGNAFAGSTSPSREFFYDSLRNLYEYFYSYCFSSLPFRINSGCAALSSPHLCCSMMAIAGASLSFQEFLLIVSLMTRCHCGHLVC